MYLIYSIILVIYTLLSLPYLFIKGKLHKGVLRRFFANRDLFKNVKSKDVIWMHGASVGEISAASTLVETIRKIYPNYQLVFSTITKTGNTQAKRIAREDEAVFYFPFDLRFSAKSFLKAIKPNLFIALETELWPNFIDECSLCSIPIILVNGRISDKAFKRYLLAGGFLKKILGKINLFCMQDDSHKDKIIKLGASKDKVFVTGNMKFDVTIDNNRFSSEKLKIISDYLSDSKKRLIIAGSTHPTEETKILDVFKRVKGEFNDLFLFIAPRHIERTEHVKTEVAGYNFSSALYSQLTPDAISKSDIVILDTIGELRYLYELSSVVVMGGSFISHGGQNPIEAAYFSKPVIFGPHMENFKHISNIFLDHKAAIQVKDTEQLLKEIKVLLNNPDNVKVLGERAREVVDKNRGASSQIASFLKPYLNSATKE